MPMLPAYKASSTTRYSSTTPTADPDLQLTLVAGKTYRVRGVFVYSASATCAFKWALSSGSATLANAGGMYMRRSNEAEYHLGSPGSIANSCGVLTKDCLTGSIAQAVSGKGTAANYQDNSNWIWFQMLVTVGGTGGTFSLNWSQNVSSATEPATLLAGSAIYAEEIVQDEKRQWVWKTTAETRRRPDGITAAADSEVTLNLEPDTDYWFESVCVGWTYHYYNSELFAAVKYDGLTATTPRTSHSYRVRHTRLALMNPSYQPNQLLRHSQDALVAPSYNNLFDEVGGPTAAARSGVWMEGHLRTDSTGGPLSLYWLHSDNGAGGTTPSSAVHPGSFLIVEKLNPCTFGIPTA